MDRAKRARRAYYALEAKYYLMNWCARRTKMGHALNRVEAYVRTLDPGFIG